MSTQRHTVPDSNFVEKPVPTWEHTSRPFETLEKSVECGKSAELDRDHNFFKPRVLEREKAVRKLLSKTFAFPWNTSCTSVLSHLSVPKLSCAFVHNTQRESLPTNTSPATSLLAFTFPTTNGSVPSATNQSPGPTTTTIFTVPTLPP